MRAISAAGCSSQIRAAIDRKILPMTSRQRWQWLEQLKLLCGEAVSVNLRCGFRACSAAGKRQIMFALHHKMRPAPRNVCQDVLIHHKLCAVEHKNLRKHSVVELVVVSVGYRQVLLPIDHKMLNAKGAAGAKVLEMHKRAPVEDKHLGIKFVVDAVEFVGNKQEKHFLA